MDISSIERITEMEGHLDKLTHGIKSLSLALDLYEDLRISYEVLDRYYRSSLWRNDYESDERNELPSGLQRGVLSEDGLWNALDSFRSLALRISSYDDIESKIQHED